MNLDIGVPVSEREYNVRLKRPHPHQLLFLRSGAKRKIIRAGRRSGKTTGVAILAVEQFLAGRRILYAAPTDEQTGAFWREVKQALRSLIDGRPFQKTESERLIERPSTNARIKAKTAWNADTLRGDYADLLILDEWQLMAEETWEVVGAPMLLDNNGDAVFIYTPPSLYSRSGSRAKDPRHASKMYSFALQQMRDSAAAGVRAHWHAFHFTSQDNPHISRTALEDAARDMPVLAFRQEILAEDLQDLPGALWSHGVIQATRVKSYPQLSRIGVGVDPPGGAAECGIVVAGVGQCSCTGKQERHAFVIADQSLRGTPDQWAKAVVQAHHVHKADRVYAEKNFGGDMVASTIRTADPSIPFQEVYASRGKAARAEPVSALYEQGKVHHVGSFTELEEEMVSWLPGTSTWSPNRVDALVWILSELMLKSPTFLAAPMLIGEGPSYWHIE